MNPSLRSVAHRRRICQAFTNNSNTDTAFEVYQTFGAVSYSLDITYNLNSTDYIILHAQKDINVDVLKEDTWQFVVLNFNGYASENIPELYIDGILAAVECVVGNDPTTQGWLCVDGKTSWFASTWIGGVYTPTWSSYTGSLGRKLVEWTGIDIGGGAYIPADPGQQYPLDGQIIRFYNLESTIEFRSTTRFKGF